MDRLSNHCDSALEWPWINTDQHSVDCHLQNNKNTLFQAFHCQQVTNIFPNIFPKFPNPQTSIYLCIVGIDNKLTKSEMQSSGPTYIQWRSWAQSQS